MVEFVKELNVNVNILVVIVMNTWKVKRAVVKDDNGELLVWMYDVK